MRWQSLIRLFLYLLLCITVHPANVDANNAISPANGEIKLDEWDFERDGTIKLDGEWAFYWQQLLTPTDFPLQSGSMASTYVNVPDYWSNYKVNGLPLPSDGYATYRLTVSGLQSGEQLGLKLRNVYSSYALWVNDRLVISVGLPGATPEETTAQFGTSTVVPIASGSDGKLTILLQVANYEYPKGGINNSLILGTAKQLYHEKSGELVQDSFIIGSLMVMAVYHLFLYGLRRNDVISLYFGLFCLCIAVRTMLVGSRYILEVFPMISWEWFAKASYLTVYVGEFFLISFIYHLFPQYLSRIVWRTTQGLTLVLTVLVIVSDVKVYDYSLVFFEVYSVGLVLYAVYAAIQAIRQRQEGAILLFLGFSLLFVTALNDTLNRKGIIETPALLQLGVLGFVFLQALLLSMKFTRAYIQVERLSDRLLTLDKLKDDFLAKTSHELRTPLHGIIGLADALIDGSSGKLTSPVTELLQLIKISGQRLAHLVDDILDFSKLKHQEIVLVPVTVNLQLAVELTIQVVMPLARKKGLLLSQELADNLYVTADENRLQQILYNLIGNAITYTDTGSIIIKAYRQHGQVIVKIVDTGIGIEKSDQARIFDSFEQLHSDNRPSQGGSGIGLSITKKLVELHGGYIEVISRPGHGSTFTFTLPWDGEEKPLIAPLPIFNPGTVESFSQYELGGLEVEAIDTHMQSLPAVLIVDDDPINIQVLVQFLTGRYSIRSTCNGQEAIDWIQEGYKPDIALLDVMMPYVSGLQIGAEIRRYYTSGELPVIFLSAKSQITDLVAGFQHGGNDYLIKPFDKQELFARLELHLQLARWHASLEHEVKARTSELEQSMEERARAIAEVSVLAERNRIARDIHDHVGHILTAGVVQLEAGMKLMSVNSPDSLEKLKLVSELVRKGLHEMRQSVHMLAEQPSDNLTFTDYLVQIIRDAEQYADVKVEHRIEMTERNLEDDTKKLIRNALQEGITNGIKHGKCTHLRFELKETSEYIQFKLENDGVPFGAEQLGFGLTMIRQSVQRLGGTFTISTKDGTGCALTFIMPHIRSDQVCLA
ncbi:ATP-binding protein [Paenibacillus arenosi]|uniref:ATP-binding protein n=1 Tax=Paenibacillus arenosi TaxID=2774142 RepID=UPI001CDB61A5|nr:ATP-binding protein [Paenibacillus arenosi]